MKKSRFTDSQIMDALKRVEAGLAVPNLCRKHGFSNGSFFIWRSKDSGMDLSKTQKVKTIESENQRYKTLLAEAYLRIEVLKVVARVKR